MEYLILGAVAGVVAIIMWLFWVMLENMAEAEPEDLVDRADDEYGLESVRGELRLWEGVK